MRLINQFRFDHEPGDSVRDTTILRQLTAMGIELGAHVSVWYCQPCDLMDADFDAPTAAP
jgi:hypothetical protein